MSAWIRRLFLVGVALAVLTGAAGAAGAQSTGGTVRKVFYGSGVVGLRNVNPVPASTITFPAGRSVVPEKCLVELLSGPFFDGTPGTQPGIFPINVITNCFADSFQLIAGQTQSVNTSTVTNWRYYYRVIEFQ
jgi:hypothetical protein